MSTDKPKTTRERIKRMRERVDECHSQHRNIAWAESLLTLIDAQAPVIEAHFGHAWGHEEMGCTLLSALEAAVDDLCGEGR